MRLPGREIVGVAGHKMGVKRARGVKFWVAGHKKGSKCAREGESGRETGQETGRGSGPKGGSDDGEEYSLREKVVSL